VRFSDSGREEGKTLMAAALGTEKPSPVSYTPDTSSTTTHEKPWNRQEVNPSPETI